MAKGKQKKRAIGRPKSTIIQKRQTTQTKKTLNPPRKSARKKSTIIQKGQTTQTKKNRPRKSIERFSNEASEIERDAANSTRPSASGTTAKIKMAEGSEFEIDDVWSVRMLVIAESLCKAVLTVDFVTFVLMNPDKVADVLEQVLKPYGVVSGASIRSIIIDLNCGSREKFLKFQKDFEDGKVKEALENELSKIGCDAKLKVTLMKVTRNVARTELRTVSQGESKAERESNQKVEVKKIPEGTDKANKEDIQLPSQKRKEDNSDAEDGFPRKKRRSSSSPSVSDSKRKKATAVKIGTPSVEELITISENIAERWKSLGRRLNIGEAELVEFERYAESERPFKMLLYWKRREAEKQPTKGTYLVLHDALCHPSVAYKGLADIICRQ